MAKGEKRTVKPPEKTDAAVERWLRDEVAPAYDDMLADPSRAVCIDDVFADIGSRHAKRATGHG